jgi:hypothetical protein
MHPILVAGTDSWKGKNDNDWFCPGHQFGQFLADQGVAPIYDDGPRPFIWSTDLDGVPGVASGTRDWAAGGAALSYFVRLYLRMPGFRTALIVHSHGLQVAAFAAAEHDLKIQTLISMGSPIRQDLGAQYKALRANTQYWLHVHSDNTDRFQILGELFDGHVGIVREAPLADKNDFVAKVGHSELLRDKAQYHHWVERGWLSQLKG